MERIILGEMNFSRLKEFVKKEKAKEIVFTSGDDDYNRKVVEKLNINILLIPLSERKDYTKQRNSGLNEVIVKILKKNGISVGIDLDELILSKNRERIFSRLIQNIELCKRVGVQMKFIQGKNKRDFKDLASLGLLLGMPTWMTKNLE